MQSDLPESSLEHCKRTAFLAQSSSLASAPHKPEKRHVEINQHLGSASRFACMVCRRYAVRPAWEFLIRSAKVSIQLPVPVCIAEVKVMLG